MDTAIMAALSFGGGMLLLYRGLETGGVAMTLAAGFLFGMAYMYFLDCVMHVLAARRGS